MNNKINWPKVDERYLEEEIIKIVVQINGKKRAIVECEKDLSQIKIQEMVEKTRII